MTAFAGRDAPTYDVVIIGGGVNGTGVARDCALRGLKVALVEKNDLAFGASGNNSGMIHGGVRYLLHEPEVTEQSCRDSGYIQRIAPFLLFRIPFVYPAPGTSLRARATLWAMDAFFSYYDVFQPLKRGKKHTLLDSRDLQALLPGLVGDYCGGIAFDEWGIDGARLCVLNMVDARANGASMFLHHEVVEVLKDAGGRASGVVARDRLGQSVVELRGRIVVNATGAWSAGAAALGGARTQLRPTKGIHVVFDRRLSNYAVVARAVDRRQVFLMPWQNVSWIGTTDDDFYGDPDDVRATSDEVRYLIQAVASVYPGVRDARVIGTTAGIRPTLFTYGPYEDELSREHELIDHGAIGETPGFYSMIGGKLASYRIFAEEASDVVAHALANPNPCRTHLLPLPGGDRDLSPAKLATDFGIDESAAKRLVYRHGARAELVLAGNARGAAPDHSVVCVCEPVLDCEVRHACREEGARTLDDIARRTRLGLGPCGGTRCAHRGAEILGEETGLDSTKIHRAASTFVADRFRSRVVGLGPAQLRQEELLAASLGALGYERPEEGSS